MSAAEVDSLKSLVFLLVFSSCSRSVISLFVVPTFEQNGMFKLCVVFLFSQFSAIEIGLFEKKLSCVQIEISTLRNQFQKDGAHVPKKR